MIVLLLLFGILSGVLGGMGMGGGTVLVPLLTIFLGLSQTVSQGINLICFVFLAVPALILHFKNKLIDTRFLWIIILGAAIFCVAGSFLANIINADVLRVCFGAFLIFLSLFEFLKIFKQKSDSSSRQND